MGEFRRGEGRANRTRSGGEEGGGGDGRGRVSKFPLNSRIRNRRASGRRLAVEDLDIERKGRSDFASTTHEPWTPGADDSRVSTPNNSLALHLSAADGPLAPGQQ